MDLLDLHGVRVLVTGGSQGIGAATVRLLHAAGASVLFTFHARRDLAAGLCDELGARVSAERVDLAERGALEPLIARTVERLDGIDVLVNNAAIFAENPFDGPSLDVWRASWERTFAVNVFAAADLAWLAMREMRRAGGGRIVNVASRAAHRGETTFADYGASKAALVNLTKSIARGCAHDGITALCVAPGFIDTAMAADALAREGDAIAAEIPSGVVGTPEDVARVIVFAASPLATYASGTTIDVNGASYVR
jgi:NAD(P)-dependent dehydrogenase (short-subunit alcohol dehydrogenase family)